MLWTTILSPRFLSTTLEPGVYLVYGRRRKRRRGRKKKTLNAIPFGLTPWPPPPETDRLSSASRPPPPRHTIIYYNLTPLPPPPATHRGERVCRVRVCFENTLTSRFARFSISPLDSSPSPSFSLPSDRAGPPRSPHPAVVSFIIVILVINDNTVCV